MNALGDAPPLAFLRSVRSPERGVQIWLASLDTISPNDFKKLSATLNSSEDLRANQFHFAQDRHRYVARRGILRSLLGEMLNASADAIEFESGPHGKLEIKSPTGDSKLRFNLSHATGLAIFALAWNRDLGIDLECADRLTNPSDELAARILSPREFTLWRALAEGESRNRALLRAWTRKEAFTKATGRGLSQPLPEIEFGLEADDVDHSLKIGQDWTLYDLDAPPDFHAALIIEQQR